MNFKNKSILEDIEAYGNNKNDLILFALYTDALDDVKEGRKKEKKNFQKEMY